MDFNAYIDRFNAGDERALAEQFFTPDIIFDGGNRRFKGREDLIAYLEFAADGLTQVFRPLRVLHVDDHIMAEFDITFTPTRDKPDFPLGPLVAGQAFTLRFFGSYYLKNGRICRIHLGNWADPVTPQAVA